MKLLLLALSLLWCAACEKKPAEEEVLQKPTEERAAPTPKPKQGDWMWKEKVRNNPLEKKK
jgi:hypothetical protein